MNPNPKTRFIKEIEVMDPDTHEPVILEIHKDYVSGSMFAIESSFLEQVEEENVISPYSDAITSAETLPVLVILDMRDDGENGHWSKY